MVYPAKCIRIDPYFKVNELETADEVTVLRKTINLQESTMLQHP